jgi:glucose-6-phosphate 1-dehydrogenase
MSGNQSTKKTETDQAEAAPHPKLVPADPCAIVIFGATGDLTNRLVMPAIYNLARTKVLPQDFSLIGVARSEDDVDGWRKQLHDMLKGFVGNPSSEFNVDHIDEDIWKRLADRMQYIQGDLNDPKIYQQVGEALQQSEKKYDTKGNAIFYLAVADRFFGSVVEQLGKAKLTDQPEDQAGKRKFWRRVVVEKPFGHSLDSARALNAQILRVLQEDQIFRIDHFLGKDTVQSIMAFRFANGIFEPIWNRDRIDHVQITAAETVGVEQRGEFYEATGALRDMVPNHLLSLLSMVAMEPPVSFDAASIRGKKADVLAAMPPVRPARAVRGQYDAGTVLGKKKAAYRQEPDVARDSPVETYVAMELEIDNWRWAGVPFYIRTGKHLSKRNTEIAIRFKQAPYTAFQDTPVEALRPNWLVLRIAPDEGISLQFEVKRRGPVVELAAVKMDFHYNDWFPKEPNVGYETLLYDVMTGDPTLFMRADMVEHSWRIVQPVLDAWAADKGDTPLYASGSDGPQASDELLRDDQKVGVKRYWRPVAPRPERWENAKQKS